MRSESRRTFLGHGLRAASLLSLSSVSGRSWASASPDPGAMLEKAVGFLRIRQGADGSWSGDRNEPGITGLAVAALLRSKRVTPDEPTIVKALAYLEGFLGDDGGLSRANHANYATAVALMAFQEANRGGRYDAAIRDGRDFLKTMQWDEGEGKSRDDPFYGGAGYGGSRSRPDLSNTTFMLDALHDTGLPPDDPALQKALIFVSRCQNLKSEFNDQPWAGKVDDGGFVYTPANGGTSVAGKNDDGGLRSYASMTYAGLRSMIYAGLTADDPRVKAARDYIARNYSVDENPGLGARGLYYYYQTFAKTLSVLGDPSFQDADGKAHDWRADLQGALAERQDANGSWVNAADSFMEGDANLVTAYGVLALAYARPIR